MKLSSAGRIQSFATLRKALLDGWELHAEAGRNHDGTRSISRNYYVLIRRGTRNDVKQATVIAAMRSGMLEHAGRPMEGNMSSVYKLKQTQP